MQCLIPLDLKLVILVCLHQRRYLLTARWRASTCCIGCLFSSSVLCLCIDFFLHAYPSFFSSFYDDSFFSVRFSIWSPPIYITMPPFSFLFFLTLTLLFNPVFLFVLSQCSVSCGGGVQTRTIQCLRQGRPAAGCLPHHRPITSRACNTHFCSAAPPALAPHPGRVTAAGPTAKGKYSLEWIFSSTYNPESMYNGS